MTTQKICMIKNILITGSNGQLGNEIRVLSETSKANFFFTDVAELDITDKTAVDDFIRDNGIQLIVNCAAYTQVDKAEDESIMADKINHLAVRNLAESCKNHGAILIHVSTDYVFDGSGNIPYTENRPTAPLGVYGRTKLDGENAVVASECRYLIIRTSWLYSSFGNNFVKTMRRLTDERDELSVVFDQVGTPTYARDLASVILEIVDSEKYINNSGTFHFSNEGVCSWYDFAIEIRDLAGNDCCIKPCHSDEFPGKVKRPHYSVLDKTKIKDTFGIVVPHWKESLKTCMLLIS